MFLFRHPLVLFPETNILDSRAVFVVYLARLVALPDSGFCTRKLLKLRRCRHQYFRHKNGNISTLRFQRLRFWGSVASSVICLLSTPLEVGSGTKHMNMFNHKLRLTSTTLQVGSGTKIDVSGTIQRLASDLTFRFRQRRSARSSRLQKSVSFDATKRLRWVQTKKRQLGNQNLRSLEPTIKHF